MTASHNKGYVGQPRVGSSKKIGPPLGKFGNITIVESRLGHVPELSEQKIVTTAREVRLPQSGDLRGDRCEIWHEASMMDCRAELARETLPSEVDTDV
jgi:hypothetical protein